MKETQATLEKPKVKYNYGPYNKYDHKEQWIRISEGCPHNCSYCYEPSEIKVFGIPPIIRNDVKIMDMNLLCKKEALNIIKELGRKRVDKKVVYYSLVCGIDYRFLTKEIAVALKESRFKKIRLAWDHTVKDQYEIKKAISLLKRVGYKAREIMVFMVCNWNIPYNECLKKLDICKVWGVQISDCYYDNQVFPNVVPVKWTDDQNKDFRRKVRYHNQLVNFGLDPNIK